MKTPLHTLYQRLLESANMKVGAGDNWLVSLELPDGETKPVTVSRKRLIIPAPEVLRKGPDFWQNLIAFHPLSESIIYGESEVQRRLNDFLVLRISQVVVELIKGIVDIAATPTRQKKLTPDCLNILRSLADIDEKALTTVHDIIRRINVTDAKRRLIHFYVRKGGGKMNGRTFNRVCVVSSPLREALLDTEARTVFDVKLRKRSVDERQLLLSLFDFIFPDFELDGVYSSGSNSPVAPNFVVLLQSYRALAERLNYLTGVFSVSLDNPDSLLINLDWVDLIENVQAYEGSIEPMEGNIGRAKSGGSHIGFSDVSNMATEVLDEPAEVSREVKPAPVKTQPAVVQTPTHKPEESKVSTESNDRVSVKSLFQGNRSGNFAGSAHIAHNAPVTGPMQSLVNPAMAPQPVFQQPAPIMLHTAPQNANPGAMPLTEAFGGNISVSNQGPVMNQPLHPPMQQHQGIHSLHNTSMGAAPVHGGFNQQFQQPVFAPSNPPANYPVVKDAHGNMFYQITDQWGNVQYQPIQHQQIQQQQYETVRDQHGNLYHAVPNGMNGFNYVPINTPALNERQSRGGYR